MTFLIDTLAILGFGLIGGSVAAACKARGVARRVIAVARSPQTLRSAYLRGFADVTTTKPTEAVQEADMVMLATPIGAMVGLVERVAPYAARGTIFTDVGSVKASLIEAVEEVLPGTLPFVGAHPLAGKEKSGVDAASADLFEGRKCIVTPGSLSTASAVERVVDLWESLGAEVVFFSPAEHDRMVAAISHLPQVLASTLVHAAASTRTSTGPALAYAASGFRDVSRIAASDAEMWRDICLANREAIKEALATFETKLAELTQALDADDERGVTEFFRLAREQRALYFP
ncbi:MAG: prephenate dehydrogenase/arogenate dehydrogenase family protein [Candidatus Tectomicrobia bacterium]|nr:prephenate dehydrogenase/arogenate dehydrogenase family protein [Candidatus Tectomicrobia bacterium]